MLRDDAKPPADRLRAYFQALADITQRAEYRFCCMIGNLGSELGGTTPSIRVEIAAIMASWSGAIADCIRHGQRDGSIRGDMEPGSGCSCWTPGKVLCSGRRSTARKRPLPPS
jgi:TetR/AcrR family transcriptional repressor of nem operon